MRADIHPEYVVATVKCSCGNTFETRSTKATLTSELCSQCHPFYTGKQKLVDTGGRIDRFERRYGKRHKSESPASSDASSTRHEELLFLGTQLQQVWKLRRVLSGMAHDGAGGAGLELLTDRMKTFKTNAEFLAEIGKAAG